MRKPRKRSNGKLANLFLDDNNSEYRSDDSELTIESNVEAKSKSYLSFPAYQENDWHSCMPKITDKTIKADTFIENLISYLSGDEYEDNQSKYEDSSNDSSVKTRLTEKIHHFKKNYLSDDD